MEEIKKEVYEKLLHLERCLHRGQMRAFMGFHPRKGQGRVLSILKMKPEVTQKELAFLLDMSKQGVSMLLDKLERNGFIVRTENKDDKRGLDIKLTEKGSGAGEKVVANLDSGSVGILDCLDEGELKTLSRLLEKILDTHARERKVKMEKFMKEHNFTDQDFGCHFGGFGFCRK